VVVAGDIGVILKNHVLPLHFATKEKLADESKVVVDDDKYSQQIKQRLKEIPDGFQDDTHAFDFVEQRQQSESSDDDDELQSADRQVEVVGVAEPKYDFHRTHDENQ
jgi:hypothetical protein